MVFLLFVVFILMVVIGVPIAFALAFASIIAMVMATPFGLDIIIQSMVGGVDSFPLAAIPFFILAGQLMGKGGMSRRIITFARNLTGALPAGMAVVMVMASIMFAAISGSTAATTATIGAIMIPVLARSPGFNLPSAAALQTTSGSIGVIIPPSVPLILMGVIAGISIGDLFLAGIVPGLIMGVSLIIVSMIMVMIRKGEKFENAGETIDNITLKDILVSMMHAILPMMTLVIILGGIIGGIFTPTEAGLVAVVYAFLVCTLIYGELRLSDLTESLQETVVITAVVVLCISAASPFAWLLTVEQIPQQMAHSMLAITESPFMLIGLMLLCLIIIGTFLDLTPAMLILVPVFLPIASAINMPDLQFGLMVTMALAIGQCTPPLGVSLFVACGVAKCKISDLVIPLIPFLAALMVALLIIASVPELTTWLPNLLK